MCEKKQHRGSEAKSDLGEGPDNVNRSVNRSSDLKTSNFIVVYSNINFSAKYQRRLTKSVDVNLFFCLNLME